jgi:hypothetical protein
MTAAEKIQTSIQRAVKLEEVPAERFSVMVQKTILGALLAGLGIYLIVPHSEGMKLYIGVGLVILGCTVWSGQLVTGALKALVGPLKALKGSHADAS